jgi:poly(3-hydroxybutyrate) depolymerase
MHNKRSGIIVPSLFLIIFAFVYANIPADCKLIFNDGNQSECAPQLYKVKIQTGRYHTASGATRRYALYLPQADGNLPEGHYPLVVLLHGFLMTGAQHRNNAAYFASHGIIALTPDLTKVLLGDQTRMRNVGTILAEISWLIEQSKVSKGSLAGMVDTTRIGIAGNSAGGAACLELLLEAQKAKIPINAMCSLDGVPWDRSWDRLCQLEPVNILSLRAEPGLCNYHSRMLQYLALLKFPFDD